MLVRSKLFLQFVKKIEKLKLSLSRQHNKMLKTRFQTLKIRKNDTIIKLEKNSRKNFSNPGIPANFLENFPFTGNLKIREKGKTLDLVHCAVHCAVHKPGNKLLYLHILFEYNRINIQIFTTIVFLALNFPTEHVLYLPLITHNLIFKV